MTILSSPVVHTFAWDVGDLGSVPPLEEKGFEQRSALLEVSALTPARWAPSPLLAILWGARHQPSSFSQDTAEAPKPPGSRRGVPHSWIARQSSATTTRGLAIMPE